VPSGNAAGGDARYVNNNLRGQRAEDFLRTRYGSEGSTRIPTSEGLRKLDNRIGDIGQESKVGSTPADSRAWAELVKDDLILSDPTSGITEIEWHFFRSSVNGSFGPTPLLRELLESVPGIRIVEHPDIVF
jgi:hypothetical protein